ncbi:Wd40-repeat-containing domain protein [Thalictrum thalictroides]|uniref:Wd40-repeat-containing domain protein n=1 Tax=Thalictrum thalictroides TaxID=46969 RepID=A0A7J6USA4_THATH|nr:Wd40-repeat-containing domain protein [Thalictrum thalictroides]
MEKGKIFLVILLFCWGVFLVVDCNSSTYEEEEHNQPEIVNESSSSSLSVLDRQEIQLKKLESLVENLTQIITKLETISSSSPPTEDSRKKVVTRSVEKELRNRVEVLSNNDKVDDGSSKYTDVNLSSEEDLKGNKIALEGERVRGGASVTKYNPSWSERFQFLSAVKLESEAATCINVLPFEDYEGFSKYIAVGDERGRVYVFLPNGDVLVEFHTLSESRITAMLSYMSVHKNESVLVTGHVNGVILVHLIWEVSNGEEWHSLSMENFSSFTPAEEDKEQSSVSILEVHHVGRMKYILASDVGGNIKVLRENGSVYGSAISKGKPLAFVKQRLLFLTETGAGSLDLRSMRIRETECEGMNHSRARNYVFDVTDRSKAYGFTWEGDMIHVVLLGDIMNFKCRVRSKRKFEMDGPLVFQAIKGYLLVVSEEKVFVYNISSQHYIRAGAPRPLFFASLDEIRSTFLNLHGLKEVPKSGAMPLVTTDREKLIVLGLGSGYVGMYRSNLPLFNTEFNTMLWTSPVLVFLLFLFGVWHFFGKKKESLTLWGSEDPFTSTSVTTGSMVASGAGDRPFADSSSRNNDLRDLRGGALRGPSRRYASPTRYSGGAAAMPFRPNSNDPNYRTSSTDHNFRAATELKYRGANLDAPGFPKRRETLFPNSPPVEDNSDVIN